MINFIKIYRLILYIYFIFPFDLTKNFDKTKKVIVIVDFVCTATGCQFVLYILLISIFLSQTLFLD